MGKLLRATPVVAIAVAAGLVGAAPAAAAPEPLPVASAYPANGARLQARSSGPYPFKIKLSSVPKGVTRLYWEISRRPTLDQSGFLDSQGLGETGNEAIMIRSRTNPRLWTLRYAHSYYYNEGTYYWQAQSINLNSPDYASPVYRLVITPAPPSLSLKEAKQEVQSSAANHTNNGWQGLEMECTRKTRARFVCRASWRSARVLGVSPSRYTYRGSFVLFAHDEPGVYDPIWTNFSGRVATNACLRQRTFAQCSRPVSWKDR